MDIVQYANPPLLNTWRNSLARRGWPSILLVLKQMSATLTFPLFGGSRSRRSLSRTIAIDTIVVASATSAAGPGKASVSEDIARQFRQMILPELEPAYNFARFLTRNPDAAQDVVQDAFLKALRGFEAFRGGDPRAWIFAIVRNCYHDWLRDHRRKRDLEVDVHDEDQEKDIVGSIVSDEDSPEMALLRKSEAQSARIVLMAMTHPLREILVLRELEGLSYREIAETTALPIGTVMSRLARARKEFAAAWVDRCALETKS
jgi:RNA polymerase sigma factor (sigma-70 family)